MNIRKFYDRYTITFKIILGVVLLIVLLIGAVVGNIVMTITVNIINPTTTPHLHKIIEYIDVTIQNLLTFC